MSETVISCRGLRKYYADVRAVDGLDLEVRSGECFGLLGPNGAGKTTTIEMLEGLNHPSQGEIEVLGLGWERGERHLRERIGLSLQETKLNEKLTVIETIRLFRSFFAQGRDPEELLDELSLREKRDARVAKLSGGQRQRLAVATALVGNPEILFLDEPTTGLDPQSRRQLWDHIERFRGEGGTVLLTTHYMDEAEQLCDRIAIVDHGRVISHGTPRELIGMLDASHIIEVASDPMLEASDLEAIEGVHTHQRRETHWWLTVDSLVTAVPALLAMIDRKGSRLVDLSTHRATLEDLFLSMTGRELRDS